MVQVRSCMLFERNNWFSRFLYFYLLLASFVWLISKGFLVPLKQTWCSDIRFFSIYYQRLLMLLSLNFLALKNDFFAPLKPLFFVIFGVINHYLKVAVRDFYLFFLLLSNFHNGPIWSSWSIFKVYRCVLLFH